MASNSSAPQPLSIEEFARLIKQRDPRLRWIPDEEIVRKVLERRPEMLNFIQRSEQRPAMGSLYERIGGRLKEDLNLPKQAQSAAEAVSAGLKNIRENGPSQMPAFIEALKQYRKPENAIGDTLAAIIMGQAGGKGPVGKPTPTEAPLRGPIASAESFEDMMTRRGPGESPSNALNQKRGLVDNLRMRYERQRAANDPGMWATASKLRDASDALKQAELKQWEAKYQQSAQVLSKQGGGGANYTAADLEAFKKKYGIGTSTPKEVP